jgi:AcrR family transcriptional regulator
VGRPKGDPDRDLRGTLLQISQDLLNEGGPSALSMREVARRAGCTHQAPYHYFEDRESILAALVTDGFERLAERLREANDAAPAKPARDVLVASALAYVTFAATHPATFRIMFRPDMCNPARFPHVREAGERARAQLDRLNEIACEEQATQVSATLLWAHAHGLACLVVDGPLSAQFETTAQLQAHLRVACETFADQVLGGTGPESRSRPHARRLGNSRP